jgi:hypothetical protein
VVLLLEPCEVVVMEIQHGANRIEHIADRAQKSGPVTTNRAHWVPVKSIDAAAVRIGKRSNRLSLIPSVNDVDSLI